MTMPDDEKMLKREYVYNELAGRIRSGEWPPGHKIPAEPVLCRKLGVARVTLRAALEKLTCEGLIIRSRPGGTVVADPEAGKVKLLVVTPEHWEGDLSAPAFYIMPGIERRCLELNLSVEYLTSAFLPEHLPEDGSCLGVINLMANFNGGEPLLRKLRNLSRPVVCAHGFPRDPAVTGLPTIRTDFHAAFKAGLAHLVRMGHRKICFLFREWSMAERRMCITEKSFPELLRESGLDPARQALIQLESNDEDFSARLKTLLDAPEPPTAVYAYSDYFALRCYELLKGWRLRIPEQIAVMGFSGYSAAALQSPPLSTVDFGYARTGAMAVDMLRRSSEWRELKKPPVILAPFDVIPRKSTDFCRMDFSKNDGMNQKMRRK